MYSRVRLADLKSSKLTTGGIRQGGWKTNGNKDNLILKVYGTKQTRKLPYLHLME